MTSKSKAILLLNKSAEIYDKQNPSLKQFASKIIIPDFFQGALWMQQAMEAQGFIAESNKENISQIKMNIYGLAKYFTALTFAIIAALAVFNLSSILPLAIITFVFVFYVIEVQTFFLFPLLLDNSKQPLKDSRKLLLKAGGTGRVLCNVLVLAVNMLLGGFAGKGFTRSWCLGCLSVVLWYLDLKKQK